MINFLTCVKNLSLHVARFVRDVSSSFRVNFCNYKNRDVETFEYELSKLCMLFISRSCLKIHFVTKQFVKSQIFLIKKQSFDFLFNQFLVICFFLNKNFVSHSFIEIFFFLFLSFSSWFDRDASLKREFMNVSFSNVKKFVLQMNNSVTSSLIDSTIWNDTSRISIIISTLFLYFQCLTLSFKKFVT